MTTTMSPRPRSNVERRLGVSALLCPCVLASVLYATKSFRMGPAPVAGLILAPSCVWITIACVLTFAIWDINEPRQSVLPKIGDNKNAPVRWANLGQLQASSLSGSESWD